MVKVPSSRAAGGSFTFTPTTGFSGTASFQYFVKDAAAATPLTAAIAGTGRRSVLSTTV